MIEALWENRFVGLYMVCIYMVWDTIGHHQQMILLVYVLHYNILDLFSGVWVCDSLFSGMHIISNLIFSLIKMFSRSSIWENNKEILRCKKNKVFCLCINLVQLIWIIPHEKNNRCLTNINQCLTDIFRI